MAALRVVAAAATLALLAAAVAPQAAAEPAGVAELEGRAGQLRAALAAHPSSFEAALELASTLHQLDHSAPNGGKRVPEAAAAYRRAAELAPQAAARAAVLSNLAALLLAGGRVAEAAEVMTSTLALARELGMEQSELYVGTLFNLAKAEQQLGRQEAAQRLLREVLRRSKGVAGATYTKAWAALKQFTPEERRELEEAVRYLRRSARGVDESSLSASRAAAWRSLRQRWGWLDGLGAVDRSWIFWGAFHAFQQEGRYDLAWRALHEGNSLQDAAQPYDPQQDETLTQSIMRMFQPPKRGSADPADAYYAALMQGAGGHRDPRFRPIFVAGLPRSGSTLIEQVLASHSQVWGAGEDTALAPLLPELLAVLNSQGNVEASRIAAVGRKYADEMWARLPPERQQGRDGSSNGGGSGSSSSGDGGQDQVRWIVDKMLRNWWHIGFIAMMLPDACIVHAVRHPADAGLSCFAQPFEGRGTPWASNLSHIAHQIQLVHRLGEHWDAVLPGRVLHVRYEDLVRDQEATTRRLLDHCGIPWQDAVLRFHETQRTVATASLAQVRQRLYSSSVGRWRRYARQLAPLLRPLRQLIARYERQAGLDSSEQLMAEVLEGSADEQRGGSGSSGGGSGGGGSGASVGKDTHAEPALKDEFPPPSRLAIEPAMRASALGTLLALSLALGCWARQQPVQGRPNRLEGQPASPAYCQGRALAQPPPPPPAAEPPPRFSSNVDVQWSVLRASHGGGIVQDPDSGLRYIAVPGAATLGTVLRREPQANASACAAACTRQRNCAAFNWCPTGASPGCRMDSSLSFLPPGSCHTIQPTAILTPSILPLLASGSSLQTIAGAPLAPDLLALPQYVPGYDALLGFSLFGVGNNVPCPESFADNYCALASELPALAAACDSKPWCTTVNTLLAASMGVRMVQGPVNSLIGVLKAVNKTVQPHHLCYTPFSALYTQHDRVPPLPAPPPYSLPATTGQPPVPASPQPGTAASPPGTSPPSSAAPPPALPDDHDMFWSILRRPQGELRRVGDVWVIAAPNVPLPGITVSGQSVEPSFDACVRRCVRFPDCYSFTYCPADSNTSCVIGTMGVSSIPPGGCLLLYEEGVAKTWSIPILAWGPSMKTMGGIPVTSPANNSVPGYHQHLGQALLGAHDIPKSLCPDSTRLDFCRVEATLEEAADRCNRHPNCTAFTFREVPLPGETNRSSAVLKGGPTGTVIDPSKVNWNPGLSLYVKEGSPLADAAPLPRPGPLVAAASSPQQQQQQQQVPSSDPLAAASASSDLSPGLIAGIAVPAVLAAAVTLAAALLVCRRRRRRQGEPAGLRLPVAIKRTGSGADALAPEVAVVSPTNATLTTPRQRSGQAQAALPATPVAVADIVESDTQRSSLDSQADTQLLGIDPSSSRAQHGGGGVSSGGQAAAGQDGRPLQVADPASPHSSVSAGSSAPAAAEAAAAAPAEGVAALAWAAELLAGQAPGWQEALVSEADITFMTAPDGRRISLGAGASGHVYKVLLGGHTQCAAKIVEWHGRQHSQLHFVQEAAMLRRLRHPNVVGFQGVVVTEERGILLMEFCAGKDLDNCMHSRSRATGERVFNWYNRGRRAVLDIATGLAYLHSCRVLHLDLKPHNVLLSREGVAKIGDVGFSRLMSRTHLSVGGIFGTYDWAAPEVLMGRGATEKSDVWSLGVIIWELCSGLRPRRGQLTPLRVSEDCPAEVAALQVECVHSDPARRPSAAEIVQLLMQLPPSRRPAPQTPASRQPAVAAVPAALVTPVTSTAEAGAPRSAPQQQRRGSTGASGSAAALQAQPVHRGLAKIGSAAAGPLVQAASLPSCLGDAVLPQLSPAGTISTAGSSLIDSSLIAAAAAAAAAAVAAEAGQGETAMPEEAVPAAAAEGVDASAAAARTGGRRDGRGDGG